MGCTPLTNLRARVYFFIINWYYQSMSAGAEAFFSDIMWYYQFRSASGLSGGMFLKNPVLGKSHKNTLKKYQKIVESTQKKRIFLLTSAGKPHMLFI